jgi:hypothetical protein
MITELVGRTTAHRDGLREYAGATIASADRARRPAGGARRATDHARHPNGHARRATGHARHPKDKERGKRNHARRPKGHAGRGRGLAEGKNGILLKRGRFAGANEAAEADVERRAIFPQGLTPLGFLILLLWERSQQPEIDIGRCYSSVRMPRSPRPPRFTLRKKPYGEAAFLKSPARTEIIRP